MKISAANIAVMLSLVGVQSLTIPALRAASLEDASPIGRNAQIRTGTFAGARIRLAIGGQKRESRLRAGFTFASMQSGRSARGAPFTRFGEGLEFGITDRAVQPHMSIAGHSLAPKRLGAAEDSEKNSEKKGGSGLRTAALVVGGLLIVGAGIYVAKVAEGARNTQ
jgi:hypothetical protein